LILAQANKEGLVLVMLLLEFPAQDETYYYMSALQTIIFMVYFRNVQKGLYQDFQIASMLHKKLLHHKKIVTGKKKPQLLKCYLSMSLGVLRRPTLVTIVVCFKLRGEGEGVTVVFCCISII